MTRVPITTADAPAPSGAYSQGVVSTGPLLFCAGQGPYAPDGRLVDDSVADQVRQTLANLDAVCVAAGTSLKNAVRLGVFLSSLDHFAEMNAVLTAYFDGQPFPARTTIETPLRGFDVEIDAVVAFLPNNAPQTHGHDALRLA